MEKIDRLGWAAGTSFVSYGVRIGVRVNQPEVLKRLPEHFPPGWKPSPSPRVERLYSLVVGGRPQPHVRRYHLLYSGVARRARTFNLDELLERFEADLRLQVASAAPRRIFVHAGVVAWRGRAIVVPGRSFSGKTTLVAELLRAGATYYSDEFAVFDGRGRVHPFPKPLAIRETSGSIRKCSPQALGSRTGARPLPVAMIALAHYQERAFWQPERLSLGRGLLELLSHTVPVRRKPETSLATLQPVVSRAVILKGARGEAKEAARSLLSELDRT
jgi:hypothetical protein